MFLSIDDSAQTPHQQRHSDPLNDPVWVGTLFAAPLFGDSLSAMVIDAPSIEPFNLESTDGWSLGTTTSGGPAFGHLQYDQPSSINRITEIIDAGIYHLYLADLDNQIGGGPLEPSAWSSVAVEPTVSVPQSELGRVTPSLAREEQRVQKPRYTQRKHY